ncbi:MAG TPA: cation transporter, partial [Verrucomicrobiae bacterium]|nr:cation transporter [Verrucomicrobiae bacterium]
MPATDTHLEKAPATELVVTGMTCNNCARHVTEAIQSVPGVRNAAVSLQTGRASVKWNPGTSENLPAIVSSVKAAGYEAKPVLKKTDSHTHDHSAHEHKNWNLNLWLGGIVTAALMIGDWGFNLEMTPWFQWAAFVLAGVVQIVCGAQFYGGAWRQLKAGRSNMDTLVALGSTTAFGYSVWALLSGAGGHLYFMEAAAIITLISIGHWIEARVS